MERAVWRASDDADDEHTQESCDRTPPLSDMSLSQCCPGQHRDNLSHLVSMSQVVSSTSWMVTVQSVCVI